MIACRICNRKMKLITNTHLKLHGITQSEYLKEYGPVAPVRRCRAEGCNRLMHAQDLCTLHYQRFMKRAHTNLKEWEPQYGTWDLTESEKAYLGGFIDADGYIGLRRYKIKTTGQWQYNPVVQVGNTNQSIPSWLQELFGGYLRKRDKRKANYKPCYHWGITNRIAVEMLKLIVSYLRMKREQAEIVIDAFEERHSPGGPDGYSEEHWEYLESLYFKMKKLNKRGVG